MCPGKTECRRVDTFGSNGDRHGVVSDGRRTAVVRGLDRDPRHTDFQFPQRSLESGRTKRGRDGRLTNRCVGVSTKWETRFCHVLKTTVPYVGSNGGGLGVGLCFVSYVLFTSEVYKTVVQERVFRPLRLFPGELVLSDLHDSPVLG